MMKGFFLEHKIECILAIVAVLLVGGEGGYYAYQKMHDNTSKQVQQVTTTQAQETSDQSSTAKDEIKNSYTKFDKESDRAKKLQIYKDLVAKESEFTGDGVSTELQLEYQETCKKMKEYFIQGYDKKIESNTLKNLDKVTDKKKINKAKTALNDTLNQIKEDSIATTDEISSYEDQIKALKKKYDKRIDAIKKEESDKEKADKEQQSLDEAASRAATEPSTRATVSQTEPSTNDYVEPSTTTRRTYQRPTASTYRQTTKAPANNYTNRTTEKATTAKQTTGSKTRGYTTDSNGKKHYYTIDENGNLIFDDGGNGGF